MEDIIQKSLDIGIAKNKAIEAIKSYVDLKVNIRDGVDEIDVITALFARVIRENDIYSDNQKAIIQGRQIKGHAVK